MIDVKLLYKRAFTAMWLFFAVFAALLVLGIFKDKKQAAPKLLGAFKFALVFALVLCSGLGIMFGFGFDWFWTNFHLVFFNNDLWLLDPEISTMINMFPLEFFLAMCSKILAAFVLSFSACICTCGAINRLFMK